MEFNGNKAEFSSNIFSNNHNQGEIAPEEVQSEDFRKAITTIDNLEDAIAFVTEKTEYWQQKHGEAIDYDGSTAEEEVQFIFHQQLLAYYSSEYKNKLELWDQAIEAAKLKMQSKDKTPNDFMSMTPAELVFRAAEAKSLDVFDHLADTTQSEDSAYFLLQTIADSIHQQHLTEGMEVSSDPKLYLVYSIENSVYASALEKGLDPESKDFEKLISERIQPWYKALNKYRESTNSQ